jgi:hypothetical protein
VYPAPDIITVEIVTLEFPTFVKTTGKILSLPMLMLEKATLVALALSLDGVVVFTVSVAGLLARLPVLSVTTTVNRAPLSELTVAGVVYEAAVAPLMAVTPFFHWYVRVPVPVATTEKVADCPTTTLSLAGSEPMASVVIPVPLRGIASVASVASLTIVMPPEILPAPVGANWTWKS